MLVASGKKELSLGYLSEVVEHDIYDFEQKNIMPTHLAIVDAARGGSVLTFLDKEGERMELEKMLMLAAKFLEVLKKSTPEELAEYQPIFEKIAGKVQSDESEDMEGMESLDEKGDDQKEEIEDNKPEDEFEDEKSKDEKVKDEDKEKMKDEKDEKLKDEKEKKDFKDSKAFKDAVDKASKEIVVTIEKARSFLESSYAFEGKTSKEIKKDVLAVVSSDSFSDNEIDTAFKLLNVNQKYQSFGDSSEEKTEEEKGWDNLENKEF